MGSDIWLTTVMKVVSPRVRINGGPGTVGTSGDGSEPPCTTNPRMMASLPWTGFSLAMSRSCWRGRESTTEAPSCRDGNPQHEASHCGQRMLDGVMPVVRARSFITFWKGRDVVHEMAVHEPVACTSGNPLHPERAARLHELRDGELGVGPWIDRLSDAVTPGERTEMEPVQVHRVLREGGVHPSPANSVAKRVIQALGVRP